MASWWFGRTGRGSAWFLGSATLLISAAANAGGAASECVSASNQALTLQEQGHLLAAREQLLRCVVATCPKVVREDCEQQLSSVRAAIPTVVFQVKDQQGNDLDQVTITLDGEPLVVSVEGMPVELDPGKHQLRFERMGCVPVERTIIVAQSERDRRERVVLARLHGGPGGVAPASSAGGAEPAPSAAVARGRTRNEGDSGSGNASVGDPVSVGEPASTEENADWKPRGLLATTGLVTAGVGVLGLGASGVFALLAQSSRDEAQRYTCDASGDCGKGPDLWEEGKQRAALATSLLIGGGLLTAAGVSLYFVGNANSNRGEPDARGRRLRRATASGGTVLMAHSGRMMFHAWSHNNGPHRGPTTPVTTAWLVVGLCMVGAGCTDVLGLTGPFPGRAAQVSSVGTPDASATEAKPVVTADTFRDASPDTSLVNGPDASFVGGPDASVDDMVAPSSGAPDGVVSSETAPAFETSTGGAAVSSGTKEEQGATTSGVRNTTEESTGEPATGDNGALDTAGCNGSGGRSACQTSSCGDGRVNKAAGEECDPGAPTSTWEKLPGEVSDPAANSCNPDGPLACKRTRCGDGYVNVSTLSGETTPFEDCDPAADISEWVGYDDPLPPGFPTVCNGDGAASLKCRFSECGDGIVSPGEECDPGEDGVFGGGDSVDCNGMAAGPNACKVRFCGDGYTNSVSGEVCDPGVPTAQCTSICTISTCGDRIINDVNEECDQHPGGTWPNYCLHPDVTFPGLPEELSCQVTVCGDGYLDARYEACVDVIGNGLFYCPEDCP